MRRLRSLPPAWALSRSEARWVTQRQAALLISSAGVTGPPVPERIASELDGVHVYRSDHTPARGLLSASRPSREGGYILIDATAPQAEQRMTLMHELKHVIDGATGDGCDGLCADFAISVLVPAEWLRSDWHAGQRNPTALAERYQVPVEAMKQRLHALGLVKQRPRHRQRVTCQWYPHAHKPGKDDGANKHVAKGPT